MRLLVVTLATIENEREACLAAVRRQKGPAFEHLVFDRLPKRQAHEALYGTFMRRRGEFDLLVKVDADMVLCRDDFFVRVADTFTREPDLQVLSVGVRDFFTGRLINGLNTYRNTLRWEPTGDAVLTDQFPRDPRRVRSDYRVLAPAADHCPDPSDFQALHFGLHRGVKAVVCRQRGLFETQYRRHAELARTWRRFLGTRDRRLALAALGGELALAGHLGPEHLNFDDPQAHRALERFRQHSADELANEARRLRRATYGCLPWRARAEALRGGWATPLRCLVPLEARKAAQKACETTRRITMRA